MSAEFTIARVVTPGGAFMEIMVPEFEVTWNPGDAWKKEAALNYIKSRYAWVRSSDWKKKKRRSGGG